MGLESTLSAIVFTCSMQGKQQGASSAITTNPATICMMPATRQTTFSVISDSTFHRPKSMATTRGKRAREKGVKERYQTTLKLWYMLGNLFNIVCLYMFKKGALPDVTIVTMLQCTPNLCCLHPTLPTLGLSQKNAYYKWPHYHAPYLSLFLFGTLSLSSL